MKTYRRLGTRFALSFAAIAACTPILVHADADESSRVLRFSASSVQTEQGARELYQRIKQAAYAVCNASESDIEEIVLKHPNRCVTAAIAGAVRKVNSPQLAERYIELNGRQAALDNGVDSPIRTAQR